MKKKYKKFFSILSLIYYIKEINFEKLLRLIKIDKKENKLKQKYKEGKLLCSLPLIFPNICYFD